MEYLEKKLSLLEEIEGLSVKQSRFIDAEEMEALDAVTDEKEQLIKQLTELEEENKLYSPTIGDAETIVQITKKLEGIKQMDIQSTEKLATLMEGVSKELKDTKQRIKVEAAYSPILGEDKRSRGRRINTKDNEK